MKVNLNKINRDYLFEVQNDKGNKVLLDNKSKKYVYHHGSTVVIKII